jgi:hypothetical protein
MRIEGFLAWVTHCLIRIRRMNPDRAYKMKAPLAIEEEALFRSPKL